MSIHSLVQKPQPKPTNQHQKPAKGKLLLPRQPSSLLRGKEAKASELLIRKPKPTQ